jgi:hypothetical protein
VVNDQKMGLINEEALQQWKQTKRSEVTRYTTRIPSTIAVLNSLLPAVASVPSEFTGVVL